MFDPVLRQVASLSADAFSRTSWEDEQHGCILGLRTEDRGHVKTLAYGSRPEATILWMRPLPGHSIPPDPSLPSAPSQRVPYPILDAARWQHMVQGRFKLLGVSRINCMASPVLSQSWAAVKSLRDVSARKCTQTKEKLQTPII